MNSTIIQKEKNSSTLLTSSPSGKEQAILLIRLMPVFWLTAKIIGWKAWLKERSFPVVPLFDWLDWPSPVHYILFAASLALLLLLMLRPLNKAILTAIFITEILSCLGDQTRWQPWEYQYLFTILICLLNRLNPQRIVTGIAFVMAATYLYSGIGKFNDGYLVLVWDNIFLKKFFRLSEAARQHSLVYNGGYITAAIESIFAVGLLFKKTQKLSAWVTMAMHALILLAIGPLGINYNVIVWPWNVLMMVFLYNIFILESNYAANIKDLWPGWNKLILFCWGILPGLNYLGVWDSYLSCRLYSGHLPQMVFCIKDSSEKAAMKPYISSGDHYHLCDGKALVNLQIWAMREMNVPPYPEMRVYKKIEEQWRKKHPNGSSTIIYYRPIRQNEFEKITGE